jgi:hypothetical protein
MKQSARWTLTVSSDLDRRVRRYLAATGRKGDLSEFVEQAMRTHLLELSMKSIPAHQRPSANDIQDAPDVAFDAPGEQHYGR